MATVRKRGDTWHIQWYEPFEKKTKSMATGLVANETNSRKPRSMLSNSKIS